MAKNFSIKNYKYWYLVFAIFLFFLYTPTVSAETVNSGFVNGIWYSKTPFFAGETIRIYSAIQNESGYDIIGKIRFYDNDKIISESAFSSISGHVIQQWADWNVTEGEHNIRVEIVEAKKTSPDSGTEDIELITNSSPVYTQTVDVDTDGDNVGNNEDTDDDNDGIPDEVEIEQNTDPLTPDPSADAQDKEKEVESTDEIPTEVGKETEEGEEGQKDKSTETETAELISEVPMAIGKKAKEIVETATDFVEDGVEAKAQDVILSLEKKINDIEEEEQKEGGEKKGILKFIYSKLITAISWLLSSEWVIYTILLLFFVGIWRIIRFFRRRR